MASKAPKHDFAPSWLKIPEQESLKPGGAKSSEHAEKSGRGPRGRDDYYYRGFGPGGPPVGPPDYYSNGPVPRQRSFDNYFEERRNYSQPGKFRHHSVEDDYYNGPAYGYGYYNGYYPGGGGGDKFVPPYRSQPSPYRDGGRIPPNPRGGTYQMNGGYPPYYEGYMYDYYQGDGSYYGNGYNGPLRNGGPKRPYGERGGGSDRDRSRNGDKDGRGQDPEANKEPSLEEEFPSLSGETESPDSKNGKPINNGVWADGRPKLGAGRNSNNNMYKVLVPNKAGQAKKSVGKGSTESNSNTKSPASDSFSSSYKKDGLKENSPTPPIEILNTRFVTQPKKLGDKKSEFLKTLRDSSEDTHTPDDLNSKDCSARLNEKDSNSESYSNGDKHMSGEVNGVDKLSNGVSDLSLSPSPRDTILSSSLEAERRLLREMGWTEGDDDECELTEDEKREMEELGRQLKMRKEERNGFKRPLPKLWSPQHMSPFQPPAINHQEDDDDTDSDLDL